MTISQADQSAYLERLGFGVEPDGEDLGSRCRPIATTTSPARST